MFEINIYHVWKHLVAKTCHFMPTYTYSAKFKKYFKSTEIHKVFSTNFENLHLKVLLRKNRPNGLTWWSFEELSALYEILKIQPFRMKVTNFLSNKCS